MYNMNIWETCAVRMQCMIETARRILGRFEMGDYVGNCQLGAALIHSAQAGSAGVSWLGLEIVTRRHTANQIIEVSSHSSILIRIG